jgi:integrase/recombinase XerD
MGVLVEFSLADSPVAQDLDAAIDAFLLSRKIANCGERTIESYRDRLRKFAEFCKLRNEKPRTISKETILAYLNARLKQVRPQTVNCELRHIRAFFRWLYSEGFREDDPTRDIQKLKEPTYYPRTLSDEQVIAIVNEISKEINSFLGLRDLTLVCLLLDTGVRISEALNMTISDVDLASGFIRVVGKGSKERFVPIGDSMKVLLQRYLMRRMAIRNAGDRLFITTLGTPLDRQYVRRRLVKWAKQAGITGVRVSPHTFRFTFVRKWLQSGGDSLVLQRILGHSSPAMTAYYARLFATDLQAAHRRHSPVDALSVALKLPRQRIR